MDDRTRTTRFALAAGQGDQAAAAAFIRATQQQVWRFIAHLAGPNEADDLTQETYLRALRSLPTFTAGSSAHTWLFVIARRVVIDHHRAGAARPQPAGLLDQLPPERREAFVATQILGLSYAEAAEVCGCPVGTIRSRVARVRADLVAAVNGRPLPARRNPGSTAG